MGKRDGKEKHRLKTEVTDGRKLGRNLGLIGSEDLILLPNRRVEKPQVSQVSGPDLRISHHAARTLVVST